jgi:hypothetical protein
MAWLQKTVIIAAIVLASGVAFYQTRRVAVLRVQVQTLQQQQIPLTEQIQELQLEHNEVTRQLAALRAANGRMDPNTELLKLRNEVGQLRRENRDLSETVTKSETDFPGPVFLWEAKPQLTHEQDRLLVRRKKFEGLAPNDGRRNRIQDEIARLVEKLGVASEFRQARAEELVLTRITGSSQCEIHNPTQETLVFAVNTKEDKELVGSLVMSMYREVVLPPGGKLIVPDLVMVSPKMQEQVKAPDLR